MRKCAWSAGVILIQPVRKILRKFVKPGISSWLCPSINAKVFVDRSHHGAACQYRELEQNDVGRMKHTSVDMVIFCAKRDDLCRTPSRFEK